VNVNQAVAAQVMPPVTSKSNDDVEVDSVKEATAAAEIEKIKAMDEGSDLIATDTESGRDFSTQKLKFLAAGTLGIDISEEEMSEQEPYHKVGQYLKAAATVGGMVALII
jgi:hypothetical protein